MENLPDRLLKLLNHSEHDQAFRMFADDWLGSAAGTYQKEDSSVTRHTFIELGVTIYSSDQRFFSAHFHISPVTFKDGVTTLPYTNALPFGVDVRDHLTDVHDKLGAPQCVNTPCNKNYKSESYRVEQLQVVFWYLLPTEQLDQLRVSNHRNINSSGCYTNFSIAPGVEYFPPFGPEHDVAE